MFLRKLHYTSKSNKLKPMSIDEIPKNIKYKFIPIFGSNIFGNIVRHFIQFSLVHM